MACEWVSELNGTSAQLGMAVPIMLDVLDADGSTLPSLSVHYVLHLFIRRGVLMRIPNLLNIKPRKVLDPFAPTVFTSTHAVVYCSQMMILPAWQLGVAGLYSVSLHAFDPERSGTSCSSVERSPHSSRQTHKMPCCVPPAVDCALGYTAIEWVSSFLMARQHNLAIQCHSSWMLWKR